MKLCDVPVGLFLFGDTLCLMTEYSNEGCGREAYIVSSGETFWGGAKSKEERANLDVTPVTVKQDDLRPKGQWNIVEFDKAFNRTTIECSKCGMVEEVTLITYGLWRDFCPNCGADMRGGE